MRRATRLTAVLGVALLAFVACFSKPGAPHATGDGGTVDANESDASESDAKLIDAKVFLDAPKVFMDAPPDGPSNCDLIHRDDFNTGPLSPACSPWGTETLGGGSTATQSAGLIFEAVSAMMSTSGYCQSSAYKMNGSDGTSIQLIDFDGPIGSKMWFYATLYSQTVTYKLEYVIGPSGNELDVVCPPPAATTDPMTPPPLPFYVRWRGTTTNPTGPGIVTMHAEYSTSGNAPWTSIATCTSSNQNLGSGFAEMGANTSTGSVADAVFDNWNVQSCIPL